MILELLKFAIMFFLPTLLGKAIGMYRNFRKMNFSIFAWRKMKWSNRTVNLIGVAYVSWKLISMFLYGQANFYMTIQTRMDSPGYIIRNQYRNYLSNWTAAVPEVAKLTALKAENKDISDFPDKTLLKEFQDMEYLSEQLKIKEKKTFYSKFGEAAFLQCKYCTNDLDYLMFLVPTTIFEYSTFLVIVGLITSQVVKSKWRSYSSVFILLAMLHEANNYYLQDQTGVDLYTAIFGEDFFTLRYEKTVFIRDLFFILFVFTILIFDYSPNNQVKDTITGMTRSLEASLALLQSARLQKAAIAVNEDLKKYSNECAKKHTFKFADIISDPAFRAKVTESNSQLELERIIKQHGDTLDKLIESALIKE